MLVSTNVFQLCGSDELVYGICTPFKHHQIILPESLSPGGAGKALTAPHQPENVDITLLGKRFELL